MPALNPSRDRGDGKGWGITFPPLYFREWSRRGWSDRLLTLGLLVGRIVLQVGTTLGIFRKLN